MKKLQFVLIIVLGVLIGAVLTAGWNLTDHSRADDRETAVSGDIEALQQTGRAFVSIAKNVTPSVVNISTERIISEDSVRENPYHWFFDDDLFERFYNKPHGERSQGLGSGVIISEKGYILTNYHVIRDADKLMVKLSDDRELEAEVVGTDDQTDLAVIKIAGRGLTAAAIGNSDKLKVGEWVVAIGNPFGLSETVTAGIVSAKGRNALGLAEYEDFIQTDAAINPGNSGGALVNISGELIGINTAIETRSGGFQGVGFAIPINMARVIMEQLVESGEVTRGWLGVQIQDIENDQMMERFQLDSRDGVIVTSVYSNNPAAVGGMKTGDVVVDINGQKIRDMQQLRHLVAVVPVGQLIDVTVVRDGKTEKLSIRIGRKPADLASLQGNIAPTMSTDEINLGIHVQELTATLSRQLGYEDEEGVLVSQVDPDSPANNAGLRSEDLILEIDRNKITDVADYEDATRHIKPLDDVLLLIRRSGSTRFVVIKAPK